MELMRQEKAKAKLASEIKMAVVSSVENNADIRIREMDKHLHVYDSFAILSLEEKKLDYLSNYKVHHNLIDGLYYIKDFLTLTEESEMLTYINNNESNWISLSNRR